MLLEYEGKSTILSYLNYKLLEEFWCAEEHETPVTPKGTYVSLGRICPH